MNQTARDKLDEQLLELAIVAQQHPPLTHGRRVALSKLINAIVLSGKVCHPQSGKFTFNLYEDIYHEALQELLLYICQNIDKYDAKRASVIAWVNFLLERRFFSEGITKVLGRREITKVPIQDNLAVPEEPEDLTQIVKEYIELDPENVFKEKHINACPQANFQALVQRRLSGKSWQEIAAEFEINVGTISSFYSRCISIFAPELRKYCSNESN
ncbi:MAG: sigma-70 family RNA polymerase sigma factor [Nostoc desertorum CM1-VF14]|jgi:DNA-directed RNA polymerase specialized sigma24 family protein|nr:sigma-70 family RNA polymerase sigma factor [Nostoc desertorum CM1-VF14]